MEHRYRNALIQDLDIDELRTLFWKVYKQICIEHKDEVDGVVAASLLEVTETG